MREFLNSFVIVGQDPNATLVTFWMFTVMIAINTLTLIGAFLAESEGQSRSPVAPLFLLFGIELTAYSSLGLLLVVLGIVGMYAAIVLVTLWVVAGFVYGVLCLTENWSILHGPFGLRKSVFGHYRRKRTHLDMIDGWKAEHTRRYGESI